MVKRPQQQISYTNKHKKTLTHLIQIAVMTLCLDTTVLPQAQAASASLAPFDFTELVEQSGPAVVNIRTTEKVSQDNPHGTENPDQARELELLRRYFGIPNQGKPAKPSPKTKPKSHDEEIPRGVGSGFIISSDGYILSNAHVVDGADEVYVKLTDQREFKAQIIGLDKRTDLAVLRIQGEKLPTVKIGNSNQSKVGEWVIAIGSPFDLDNTVTAGIISAKARETGDFLPLLQTDVAINPGNSGGPLINMRGEVVGINSQIYSRSGGYMGISFAIPIDDAMRVADQLKNKGKVSRGRMGVYLADVSKDLAETLNLPKARGSLLSRIEKDGPADKAGLLEGDIFLQFNGVAIENSNVLRRLVAATAPGQKINVSLWRKGKIQEVVLVLAELPDENAGNSNGEQKPDQNQSAPKEKEQDQLKEQLKNNFGLSIQDLTVEQKKSAKNSIGVVIENAEGIAQRAGLNTGDVILSLNQQDIHSVQEFYALYKKTDPQKNLVLLARRENNTQFIVLKPLKK